MRTLIIIIIFFFICIPNAFCDDTITGNNQGDDMEELCNINGDEKVDIEDIVLLIKILKTADKQDPSISGYNGDVNSDGVVNLKDLDILKKIILDNK